MARDDAKVRVRLDTGSAKTALRGLVQSGANTAKRIGRGLSQQVRSGLGGFSLGAGIGTGIAAVRGAAETGFGDVVSESLGGLGARLSRTFLGELPSQASASKSAREETIQAFGAIAGATGKVPPSAKAYFDSVRQLRFEEAEGRRMFEEDDRFRGPGIEKLIEQIMSGVAKLLREAVDALAAKLWPF